jgi:hypothetical protein
MAMSAEWWYPQFMAQATPTRADRMSQLDRSRYYRGLLVLTGRDRIVDPRERELMLQFGQILDFDWRFCTAAIDDLLENKHITDEPVIFSSREIAECFVRDAIRLISVDLEIHPKEVGWLKAVALANGLSGEWLDAEIQRFYDAGRSAEMPATLAIKEYLSRRLSVRGRL